MTLHVFRLAVGEWHKIRRRLIPWILLGIIVLVSQGILWGFYAAYHASDDPFGALTPPYEYRDGEVSIVVTCEDMLAGLGEEKLVSISGRFAGEEREAIDAEIGEWLGTCNDYLTPDEARAVFTLPYSIAVVSDGAFLAFFAIPILILAASVLGMEYGWGTMRATLARGVGRWQLLSGKLIMLMAAAMSMVIVVAVLTGISSLLTGIVPPGEEGSLVVGDGRAWLDAIKGLAKLVFALVPYVALGVFLAVVTQSSAQGIALSMGYYVLELILAPVLGGITDWLERIVDVALLGQNVEEWMSTASATEAQQTLGTVVEQPDTLRAFFVVLAYTAALVAATLWIFHRRDVTGAKGE
ncbi:MAG: ABC transporter permease subunit [Dehalococcoidia bacterium]|nr:ABC transporter permease subunit [Dehalococcoidia bacterium]